MAEDTELVSRIQEILRHARLPAWLFYGYGDLDPISPAILRFGPGAFGHPQMALSNPI